MRRMKRIVQVVGIGCVGFLLSLQFPQVTTFQSRYPRWAYFSEDLNTVVSIHSEGITVWDVKSRTERVTVHPTSKYYKAVAISRDGATLACGNDDGTIGVWDASTGTEQHTLRGHMDEVTSVAFSPDGNTLASGGKDGAIRIWNPATGSEVMRLQGPAGSSQVAFHPDGRTLASASYNYTTTKTGGSQVNLWDLTTGKEIASFSHTGGGHLVFSPDGRMLAHGLQLWDVQTREELPALPSGSENKYDGSGLAYDGSGLAFSRDSKTLVTASYRKITIWDVQTGVRLATYGPEGHHPRLPYPDLLLFRLHHKHVSICGLAFAPDGELRVLGRTRETVEVWTNRILKMDGP